MSISPETTLMHREAAQAAGTARTFLDRNGDALAALGDTLRQRRPSVVLTCARGSSDHAATYGKYMLETCCRVPVASSAPSIASVYDTPFTNLRDAVVIAVSQSGRSPDLLRTVRSQQDAGALVVALVNDVSSPLASLANVLLPLHAGPELSVAATKSCIAAMIGFAAIAAAWSRDGELSAALDTLPDQLAASFELDWSPALPALTQAQSMFVVARGYGYGVAQEMALKLKETCGLHAESFSAAEVRHGPMAIVREGFPVLALATSGQTGASVRDVATDLAGHRATVLLADTIGDSALPAIAAHPAIEPVLMLGSFYRMVNALAISRGLSPDTPPFLSKVTRTV